MGGDEVHYATMERREMAMESHIGMMTALIIIIETVNGVKRLGIHHHHRVSPEREV
jgi:hypothetical protein